MTPTRPVRKEEIKANGHSNGHAKAPDAAPNDALLRELQALQRSEAVLRDFIETSTIGLHWVGADGTILWANQAELDLLGYAREQYIGRNITEFHADGAVITDILACLSRGEILRDRPARLRHRDGSIRHVLINSSVLFEDGEFVHTRCFTRDITDLKQEQETRQAQLAAELADTKLLQDISAQLIEPGDETRSTRKSSTLSPPSWGRTSRPCRCSIPNAGPKASCASWRRGDLARRAARSGNGCASIRTAPAVRSCAPASAR
jgi:PAS domain S-box-containing protein